VFIPDAVYFIYDIISHINLLKNLIFDLDEQGNLVSMTIEKAESKANILDFAFECQSKIAS
jgi:uncharacterized protein YuzE